MLQAHRMSMNVIQQHSLYYYAHFCNYIYEQIVFNRI